MLIRLLRHGETDWNAQKRYTGTADVPLSERGRRALRRMALHPSVVYTSTLRRTRETAEILFPDAVIIPVHDLREMDFGDFTGHNFDELQHDPTYRDWVEGGCTERCPNGTEDRTAFTERCCAAFSRLLDEALRENAPELVVVAHGGTQMAVLSRYVHSERGYFDWSAPNGGGFLLDPSPWLYERRLLLVGTVGEGVHAGEVR